MQELMQMNGVELVDTHMGRFGTNSHIHWRYGERGMVNKLTGCLTSSMCIARMSLARCSGDLSHVHLVVGRASGCSGASF